MFVINQSRGCVRVVIERVRESDQSIKRVCEW